MVRRFFFLALLLIPGVVFLSSCKKEELSPKKEILALMFEASKNADLEKNIVADIEGTDVSAEVPFSTNLAQLIPTIEISPRASISPQTGILTDFSAPVVYTVTAEDGTTKSFTVNVTPAPAPYIGKWIGGPIDFGLGLMNIELSVDATGNMTLEMKNIISGELHPNSIKGTFNPKSKACCMIQVEQTHRWINNAWVAEAFTRAMRYDILTPNRMKFYYCLCYPTQEWWFQVDMDKQT